MFGGRRSTFVSAPVKFICFSSSRKKPITLKVIQCSYLFILLSLIDTSLFWAYTKLTTTPVKVPLAKTLPEYPRVPLLCLSRMGRNLTLDGGTLNSEVLHQKSSWLISPELDNYSGCFAAYNSASWVTSKGSQAKMEIGKLVWLPFMFEKHFTWLSGQRNHWRSRNVTLRYHRCQQIGGDIIIRRTSYKKWRWWSFV